MVRVLLQCDGDSDAGGSQRGFGVARLARRGGVEIGIFERELDVMERVAGSGSTDPKGFPGIRTGGKRDGTGRRTVRIRAEYRLVLRTGIVSRPNVRLVGVIEAKGLTKNNLYKFQ